MSVSGEGSNGYWDETSHIWVISHGLSLQDALSCEIKCWEASVSGTVPGLRVGVTEGCAFGVTSS